MEEEVLLDLSQPRTVVLAGRSSNSPDKTFTLECRRITAADWTTYFEGITSTSENRGKERISVFDENTARLALVDAVLIGAIGYEVEGGVDLMDLPNWQRRIPLAHRMKLGEVLADVVPSPSAGFVIHPEGEVVDLDCTWSAVEKIEGGATMQRFTGLKHILQTPSEEQYRRYKRESSRSVVQGGSRAGRTIYRNAGPMLAKLYDELVISVDGYAAGGVPLKIVGSIRAEMDMLHKVMAAQAVMTPGELATLAGEEDGE